VHGALDSSGAQTVNDVQAVDSPAQRGIEAAFDGLERFLHGQTVQVDCRQRLARFVESRNRRQIPQVARIVMMSSGRTAASSLALRSRVISSLPKVFLPARHHDSSDADAVPASAAGLDDDAGAPDRCHQHNGVDSERHTCTCGNQPSERTVARGSRVWGAGSRGQMKAPNPSSGAQSPEPKAVWRQPLVLASYARLSDHTRLMTRRRTTPAATKTTSSAVADV
jgi:hypothetical protein